MGVEFAPGASGAPACRWETYPDYKDSGVEWLGKIPAHWDIKKLRRIFRVINGSTPKSGVLDYWDGDIVWVTPDDLGQLKSDTINMSARRITELGYQSCGTTLVPYGSLVLSTRAPIGHLAIVGIDLCTNQGCKIVVFKSNDDTRFFYYQLLTTRSELKSWGQGSTFKELGKDKLKAIELVSPTISEQRSIASFLDRKTAHIDILISKKERLITLLQEKRAALISHTVTKGLDPDVPMKDSGVEWLGEIPVHWKMARFRRICRVQQGLQIAQTNRFAEPKPNRFEYITIKSIHAGDASNLKEYIENPPKSVICTPDDILLARTGATGEVISGQNGVFHNNFFKIIYNRKLVEMNYLIYYLSSIKIQKYLILLAGTTTIPDLNHGEFLDTPFSYPNIIEQENIVIYLNDETAKLDALISKIHKAIEKLQEYRTALISAAVTGKIDVRNENRN